MGINNQDRTIRIKLGNETKNIKKEKKDLKVLENGLDFDWIFPKKIEVVEKLQKEEPGSSPVQNIVENSSEEAEAPSFDFTSIKIGLFSRVILPIVVALLIGSGFGFIALNIVKHQSSDKKVEKTAEVAAPASTSVDSKSKTSSIIEKKLTISIIQGGIFTTKAAADARKKQLPTTVPSAVMTQDQKYVLILGLSDNLDHAKANAVAFQNLGIQAFWKNIQINTKSKGSFSKNETDAITQLLSNFNEFLSSLVVAKSAGSLPDLKSKKVTVNNAAGKLAELIKVNDELILTWSAYKKDKQKAKLQEFEQKILNFCVLYQDL